MLSYKPLLEKPGAPTVAAALLALVLYPLVWLLLLPFRLLGIGVQGIFELLRAIVMLPARILGSNPGR